MSYKNGYLYDYICIEFLIFNNLTLQILMETEVAYLLGWVGVFYFTCLVVAGTVRKLFCSISFLSCTGTPFQY